MITQILVLYYSHHGSTRSLARLIARGIEKTGAIAKLRTVPDIYCVGEKLAPQKNTKEPEDPYVTKNDLISANGIAFGSPVRFGNMAAPLKHFIDSTSNQWLAGELIGKPALVFTSGSMLHGGQETTLQSMMLPLLHHGMLIMGLPHSLPALHTTNTGGTPYGPTVINQNTKREISPEEKQLALEAGKRLAIIASQLTNL